MCKLCLERAVGNSSKLLTKEEWRSLSAESRHKLNMLVESKCVAMKVLESLCPPTDDYIDNTASCYRFISECRISAHASLVKAVAQRDNNATIVSWLTDIMLAYQKEQEVEAQRSSVEEEAA